VQHLAKDELLQVLAIACMERPRDWLMFLVAYQHGLRASEVISFTRDAVRDGYLTIQRLKGSNKTVQPLVEDTEPLLSEREALETLARNAPLDSPIFPISRSYYFKLFRKYAKRAGLPAHKRHPHVLKHSLAMHTIQEAGIENVKQYLGHKSGASTLEYLKVSDAEASAAIARARTQRADGEKA
jgi:integrase/recombinase XerD